jgi:hypothetical protein
MIKSQLNINRFLLSLQFPGPDGKLSPKQFTTKRKITKDHHNILILIPLREPFPQNLINPLNMIKDIIPHKSLPHIISIGILKFHSICQGNVFE